METHVEHRPGVSTQLAQGGMWLALGLLGLLVALGKHRQLYISDSIVSITIAGGAVAIVAALFQFGGAWRSARASRSAYTEAEIEVDQSRLAVTPLQPRARIRRGQVIALLIIAAPLVLSLWVTPQAFGASSLHRQGFQMFNADASSSADTASSGAVVSGPTITLDDAYKDAQSKGLWTPSVADILLGLDYKMNDTLGHPLATLGFVYREPGMPTDKFALMRYATVHCSAEARPLGVWVTTPDAAKYADDTWVWVSGQVEISQLDGNQIAQIRADNIQLTEEPAGPYIFYDVSAYINGSTSP